MQELIWKVRPDVIVESGVAHGGALMLYASILELLGRGQGHRRGHRDPQVQPPGDRSSSAQPPHPAGRERLAVGRGPGRRPLRDHTRRPRDGGARLESHARARARQSSSATHRSSRRTATSSYSTRSWRWWPTPRRRERTGIRTTPSRRSGSSSTATTTSRSIAPSSGWPSRYCQGGVPAASRSRLRATSLTPCCFARPRCRACSSSSRSESRTNAASSPAPFRPTSSPRAGLDVARGTVQHVVQREGRHPARHALPGRAARRGQARALHARRDLRRGRRPATRLADIPATGSPWS